MAERCLMRFADGGSDTGEEEAVSEESEEKAPIVEPVVQPEPQTTARKRRVKAEPLTLWS